MKQANKSESRFWNMPGQQLTTNLPPFDERQEVYDDAGGSDFYTRFNDMPNKRKNFEKFLNKFNLTH